MSTAEPKSEFVNQSDHVQGAVIMQAGKPLGIAVRPGESVWLTQDEEVATANAPRRDEDNPFINGTFLLKTRAADVINRRPIGTLLADDEQVEPPPADDPEDLDQGNRPVPPPQPVGPALAPSEETAAPPLPEGDPAHGVRAPGEEVGTPEVVQRKVRSGGTVKRSARPAAGVPVGVSVGQGGVAYQEPSVAE